MEVATDDDEGECGSGATRGDDETAVSAAQAGVVQRRQER